VSRGARRDRFRRKQRAPHDIGFSTELAGRNDEDIRLQHETWPQLDVERRREQLTQRVRPNVRIKENCEVNDGSLVRPVWRGRHEHIALHELPSLPGGAASRAL